MARIAANFSSRHARPRQHALALHVGRGGDDDDLVDAVAAAGFEQQRDVEHGERRAGGAVALEEVGRIVAHQRMDDRFQLLQGSGIAEHAPAKLGAVDDAVA